MDEIMKEDIRKACEVMQKGGVILYPTDTIWGIGCDATNAEAVKRVYEIKKRSDSKAMLVLVDNAVKVDFYVYEAPEIAFDLIELTNKLEFGNTYDIYKYCMFMPTKEKFQKKRLLQEWINREFTMRARNMKEYYNNTYDFSVKYPVSPSVP